MSQFRMRRRFRGAGAAALGVALLVGLAGCSTDDSIDVVIEGDEDPAAIVSAAATALGETSGRFTISSTMSFDSVGGSSDDSAGESAGSVAGGEFDALDEASVLKMEISGEFSGEDARTATTGAYLDEDGNVIDADFPSAADSETISVGGAVYTRLAGPMREAYGLGDSDAEWLSRQNDLDGSTDGSSFGASMSSLLDVTELFDELVDVREDGTEELDGVTYRRYVAEVDIGASREALDFAASADDPAAEEEYAARLARIREYEQSITASEVVVLVSDDGYLRRMRMQVSSAVDPEYRECIHLFASNMDQQLSIDVTDVGADISITAPDPATVTSLEDIVASMGIGGEAGGDIGVAPGGTVTTVLGDTPTTTALSDEPRTPTLMGEMTRPEMIAAIHAGVSMLGSEPNEEFDQALESMSDQELAALIDGFLSSQGDTDPEALGEDEMWSEPDLSDEFAGCPA